MGRLSEYNALIESRINGVKPVTQESRMDDHVGAIVEAVRGIQLNIDGQEGYDYTPEIHKLGEAVTKALKTHGDALIKAIGGITVNVEAPSVTVEAPNVSVSNEIEFPEQQPFSAKVVRDENGRLSELIFKPYVEPKPKKSTVKME